jgi:hypothetical protein
VTYKNRGSERAKAMRRLYGYSNLIDVKIHIILIVDGEEDQEITRPAVDKVRMYTEQTAPTRG